MEGNAVTSLLVAAFVGWAIYRRARRNFGRQLVQERRLRLRVALLSIVGTLALSVFAVNVMMLSALLTGLVCGAILASVGLRHTKFEVTAQGRFYAPHTYIGLVVSALLIARILSRLLTVSARAQTQLSTGAILFAQGQNGPLTLGMLGVVIGYYVLFFLGVLRRSRELSLEGTSGP